MRALSLALLIPALLLAPVAAAAPKDNDGPRSSFVHTPPAEAPLSQSFVIEGSLAGASFSRLVARVRGGGDEYEDYELELQYGDLYRGTIPGSRMVPPGIEYYVEGIGANGERTPIFASSGRPVRVLVKGDVTPDPVVADTPAPPKPKCKKGKKCKDEPPPEPKPKDKPDIVEWVDSREPDKSEKPEKPPEKVEKTDKPDKVASDRTEKAEKPEKSSSDRTDKAEKTEKPDKAERPPERRPDAPKKTIRQLELEEELALYGAEAPGGVVQKLSERDRVTPQTPTVLTRADLQHLAVRYVYEALDLVPGLSVSRDVQGFYRVAVRGLRSDAELMFTLNGQRLNSLWDAHALAQLPVDNLDRIEIYRGPAGVDVGLGNVTGLINLVTRRDAGIRVSGSAGMWEMFDGHLNAAGTFGAVTLFGDFDIASQYGIRRPVARDGLDGTTARPKLTNDKRFLISGGGGVSIATESLGTFDVQGRVMSESRAALIGLFDVVGNDSKLDWLVVQANAGWSKPIADGVSLSVRAWFEQQTTNRLFQLTPDNWQIRATDPNTLFPDGVLEQTTVGTRGFGLTGKGDFALPFHNALTAGLSVEHRSISQFELLANSVPVTNVNAGSLVRPDGLRLATEDGKGARGPAADRFSLGVFVADTWTPVEIVSVQAGLRFDLTQLPRADTFNNWLGSAMTPSFGPRLGLTVAPTKSLIFRGLYGRSFRAPTVQEYADSVPNNDFNQGRFIGNPQLQGAYIDAVEASAEYVQGLGEGRLKLRGLGFFERISNEVVQVDTSGNLVPYANRLLGVQAVGLEGEARLELTQRLTAWANVSWVRPEDQTAPVQSRILTDVSQIRANGGLSLPVGRWLNVDLVARFASERRNNSRSVLELIRRYTLPGNVTFAAQLRTEPLFDHVELILLGQNVFNFEYADDPARPDRVTGGVPRETWSAFLQAKVGF
ncbi:MAG: TonB-dependent receptor [Myxococcaceae bacterium]